MEGVPLYVINDSRKRYLLHRLLQRLGLSDSSIEDDNSTAEVVIDRIAGVIEPLPNGQFRLELSRSPGRGFGFLAWLLSLTVVLERRVDLESPESDSIILFEVGKQRTSQDFVEMCLTFDRRSQVHEGQAIWQVIRVTVQEVRRGRVALQRQLGVFVGNRDTLIKAQQEIEEWIRKTPTEKEAAVSQNDRSNKSVPFRDGDTNNDEYRNKLP